MKILHFCAGLEPWNGMANTARQFVAEESARGDDSRLTNNLADIKEGADVVMIHGAWLPVLWKVAKKAKVVGAKLVIRPAGSYDPVRLAYHGWKKWLVAPFERRMLRRADVLLATCEAEVEWIKAYEQKVKAVELTDLKRFFKLDLDDLQNDKIGQTHFITSRPLHLLYLGRRHPLKGVEYLEAAVRQIENTSAHSASSRLSALASLGSVASPGVAPTLKGRLRVKYISSVFGDELEKIWDWCDVLILPTLSENFGRVIAEALERGKRVITTDGAPAWSPSASATEDKSDGNDYGGRLIYLKGYRDGSDETRISLLKDALRLLTTRLTK